MALFKDTEEEKIPAQDGYELFNADMIDWGEGDGPTIAINIPYYFETDGGVYDSCGVISAPLKSILEEYLVNFLVEDGGESIEAFAEYLRDYADRLEKKKKSKKR
jgi:hypothetical protein